MSDILIEVCVDDAACLAAAIAGGADRIELCAALALGGLTPSAGFMQFAATSPIPVFAMIRPRAGDFIFSEPEITQMMADITTARTAGLAGVVLGANMPDGTLDTATLQRLITAARPIGLTLHRAFDLVPDITAAIDTAVTLGFHRILTSGQASTAAAGVATLARCFTHAGQRIIIMPGAGISADTVAPLCALPLREIHASCGSTVTTAGKVVDLGFVPATTRRTDAARIRALRAAVAR